MNERIEAPGTPVMAAIVLAGGASRRMGGSPKALLTTGDRRPFVWRIVDTLRAAGIDEIVVVTGVHHAAIAATLEEGRVACRIARNPAPERGQLSSLVVGLDALDPSRFDGIVVALVDQPLVRPATVSRLIAAFVESGAPVVRPERDGRHGHPVIFGREAIARLRDAPLESGARTVVQSFGARVSNVPVDDPGAFDDVDTPEDYRRVIGSS